MIADEPEPDETRRMRVGLGAGLVRAWRRAGSGLLRVTPAGILGLLCAGAFGPVLAAPGVIGVSGAAAVAGIGVLGSVGANVLTNVITATVDRLRTRGRQPTQDEIELELAAQIEKALAAGGVRAEELRGDVAAVLREIDAAGVALETAIANGDRETQNQLARMLGVLSADFDEFGFMLTDVREAAGDIQETLRQQDAEHRVDRDRNRQQAIHIRLLREELAVIERRTRSARADGDDVGRDPDWAGRCPYRGLLPFEEDHAAIFYGRETRTAELVGMLAERLSASGILIVTGASGAGKSSLLRAGLMPALARGSLAPGTETWPRIVITPTCTPLDEFAIHLAAVGEMDAAITSESLAKSPRQAHLLVREALVRSESGVRQRLVLVVDQFEDVFAADEEQRDAFLTALHAMSETSSALVVLAVRGDCIDRCAALPELADAFEDGPFVIGPMNEADLRRTITGPVAAAGLEIEPGLMDTVMGDLRSVTPEVGALPLLSQAMSSTWEHREHTNDRLTIRGYGQAGGVAHAVKTSAEITYNALTADGRTVARDVLCTLTRVGRDGRLTRRKLARADLNVPDEDLDLVLNAFADKRLLILDGDTVEIVHDVLLHAWPRLRGWFEREQADRVLRGQLVDDAKAWQDKERDASFLYRGAQLATMAKAAEADLTSTALEFLTASRRANRRRVFLRHTTVVTVAVLLIAALVGGIVAVVNVTEAEHQHALALSRGLAAQAESISQSEPATAKRLAAAAWRVAATPEARYAMLATLSVPQRAILRGHGERVTAQAFSRDGKTIATGSFDKTIRLWDVVSGRQLGDPIQNDGNEVLGVALSPDGKTVAATTDRVVRLWDVVTHRQVGDPLVGHEGPVWGLAFRSDGAVLATTSADNTVRLWDVANRVQIGDPLLGHRDAVTSVAFSGDGRTIATGSWDRTARLWDVASYQQIGAPFTGHTDQIWSIALSSDGRTLATGSFDGTARLWDVTTHDQIGDPITGHADQVYGVAFSPDGATLATTSRDKTARLWDVTTHKQLGEPLTGHTDKVFGVMFSPDGKTLATDGFDGTVRLWEVTVGRPTGTPLPHSNEVWTLAFSPDGGKTLATAGSDDIRLWDVATHRQIGDPLAGHDGKVGTVAFRRDGKVLASGSADKTARLWDVNTHQPLGGPLKGHDDSVFALAFSPDGKALATASTDKTARLWDVRTYQPLGVPLAGHSAEVMAVTFSRNGMTLATGGWDHKVCVWDVITRQLNGSCLDTGADVNTVAFSPDGKTLAAAGWGDHTMRLWDVATRRQIGDPFQGHAEVVWGSAFSVDGTILATASADTTVRLWDVGTHRQIGGPLPGHSEDVFAVAFSPDRRMMATASWDHTVLLWDVSAYTDPLAAIVARVGEITQREWDRYAPGEPLPAR